MSRNLIPITKSEPDTCQATDDEWVPGARTVFRFATFCRLNVAADDQRAWGALDYLIENFNQDAFEIRPQTCGSIAEAMMSLVETYAYAQAEIDASDVLGGTPEGMIESYMKCARVWKQCADGDGALIV